MARRKNGKGVTEICAHQIKWWYDGQLHPSDYDKNGNPTLPDSEREHIQELLIDNIRGGELVHAWAVDEKVHEISGAWFIQIDGD